MLSILTMLITQLSNKLFPFKKPQQQYNLRCSLSNYKQSNHTYGKDLSHSKTSRNVQDSRTQSSFSRFTRQYRWGKSRAGCCMPICTDLSQTLHRTARSWLASREGVSNATTRGTASTEHSYTLWEPEELRRRTGRQDTPEHEPVTLSRLCYNADTQCPEGTHTWRVRALLSTYQKRNWLTVSTAPSQGLDSCSLQELESLNLVNSSENLYVAGQSSA